MICIYIDKYTCIYMSICIGICYIGLYSNTCTHGGFIQGISLRPQQWHLVVESSSWPWQPHNDQLNGSSSGWWWLMMLNHVVQAPLVHYQLALTTIINHGLTTINQLTMVNSAIHKLRCVDGVILWNNLSWFLLVDHKIEYCFNHAIFSDGHYHSAVIGNQRLVQYIEQCISRW